MTAAEAVAGIADGATILVGGFGMAGMPTTSDRRADRAGRDRPDDRQQQRRQRRHRAGRSAGGRTGAQGHLLVPAPVRFLCVRRALPCGQDRPRGRAAGQPGRTDARRRRGHRRVLLPHRCRHTPGRRQGDPHHRRPRLRAGVPDPRRRRADRRAYRRPGRKPGVPQDRPQLRTRDGHRRRAHHRRGVARRRHRRHRSGNRRHTRHLRRPHPRASKP